MSKFNDILCLSGGLDSFIAWHYLGGPPAIYFDTKLPHCEKEFQCVRTLTRGKVIVDYSLDFSEEKDIYIPHRNLLFASRASVYANKVWIAGLKDDMVEDKTPGAFSAMSYCLTVVGKDKVEVDSPFWDMTKTDIVKWFIKNGPIDKKYIDQVLNNYSISCYAGGVGPCYMCESCFRKACAMFNAGLSYKFMNIEMIEEYRKRALAGKYVEERNMEILKFTSQYVV